MASPAENTNTNTLQEKPDVVDRIRPSMSHPQNFSKHSKEVATSWVQTTVVRTLEQMQIPETKTVNEHYTERKSTCTEVSKLPCSILIIR
jgi:hypothetical protein